MEKKAERDRKFHPSHPLLRHLPLVTVNTKSGATFSPLSVFTFFLSLFFFRNHGHRDQRDGEENALFLGNSSLALTHV